MGFDQNFPNSSYSGTYDLRGNATEPLLTSDAGVQVAYTIGTEAGNVITVACQFKDSAGNDIAYPVGVMQYLATSDTGQTLKAAATSLAAGTDGTIALELTSNSLWYAISEADGDLDIAIGDASGAATYYLVTVLPSGALSISSVITFA